MRMSDEVAVMAQRYLLSPKGDGFERVEREIAQAQADSRWDDLSTWHRVRLRMIRMERIARRDQQAFLSPPPLALAS